jgi:hypothetical protein
MDRKGHSQVTRIRDIVKPYSEVVTDILNGCWELEQAGWNISEDELSSFSYKFYVFWRRLHNFRVSVEGLKEAREGVVPPGEEEDEDLEVRFD